MKHLSHYIIIVAIAFTCALTSCHTGQQHHTGTQGDTLVLRHAEYLTLIEYTGYTEVQIHSPWDKGKLLQAFRINDNDKSRYSRVISFTATHSSLIEEMGMLDALIGVCEAEYIANPQIREALATGKTNNIGSNTIKAIKESTKSRNLLKNLMYIYNSHFIKFG